MNLDCRVELPDFEGPLDLLLHLTKTHELDILNLPISKITKQYLIYLDHMRELNLDLASEYLVMAATLTYLKSRVIVPDDKEDEKTGPDPRAQLIKQLIELKCYKELAAALDARPRLFRDTFISKNTGFEECQDEKDPEVALSNPFQMAEAFKDMLRRRKGVTHNVYMDEVPVSDCIKNIFNKLKTEDSFSFESLLPSPSKPAHLISNFLSILELSKLQITGFKQKENFAGIEVYRRPEFKELSDFEKQQLQLSWE